MAEISKRKLLEQLVEQTLETTDYEAVLVEYAKAGGDWVLRVYIDKEGGIGIDDCEAATRLISEKLEAEDPIAGAYTLEVSSPGIDRPLVKHRDFVRFAGERVFVKTHRAVDSMKKFTGELVNVEEQFIEVRNEADERVYRVPLDDIAKATLKPILNF